MSRKKTKSKPLVLVTGSAGKTGAPVVEQLLEHGYTVRALVHRKDARSARIEARGAGNLIPNKSTDYFQSNCIFHLQFSLN